MQYSTKLTSTLKEIATRCGIPGLGVGIVKEGEIVYAKGFGVQSLDTRAPVTLDSVFCLASIAKCFVASAVMQLVEHGKIQLDTPLVEYLPYFKLDDDRYVKITTRQILSHTSGMPDMDEYEYEELVSHPETDEGAAERYVRSLTNRKLIAAPGEKSAYSNIAYNVLGDLIAKVSGQTFEDYLKEHLLLPAGMPDSTFWFAEVDQQRLAVPHLCIPEMIVNPVYPYHRADSPASFLHSTIGDMCRWGITCLNRGSYGGQQILTPASYDLMWAPVAELGYPPFYEQIGLGWVLGHYEGVKTVSHGGMGFGWACFFTLLPEANCAAIILCNAETEARSRLIRAVVDAMLDRQPLPGMVSWVVPICQALQEGGIRAAYACYAELKNSASAEYEIDEDALINLTYQLMSVKKLDLTVEVLNLNIHAFPEYLGSYIYLAKLYLQKGERAQAEETLKKALEIKPDSTAVVKLLEEVQR